VASENRDSGFCNARNLRPVKSRSRDPRSHERRGDVVEWGLQSEWRTGGVQLGFCVARDHDTTITDFPICEKETAEEYPVGDEDSRGEL
jgi:hypothetical protein